MNTVAANTVATMMSSNVSALKSANLMSRGANQDFSKVIQRVNQQPSQTADAKQTTQTETKFHEVAQATSRKDEVVTDVSKTESPETTKEIEGGSGLDEKVQEVTAKMDDEQANVKAVLDTEEGQVIYDEAMTLISEMFGIDLEVLQSVMQELNVDLLDLSDKGNLVEVVQTVFDHETVSEVLLDAQASEAFKTVNAEVTALVEKLDIDLATLEAQISLMTGNSSENLERPIEVPVATITDTLMNKEITMTADNATTPTLEVVDLRSDQETSQFNQNQNGQNQGNQTFGEMMSQQLTEINEVVVGTTNEQSDFQQIRTMELIDQLVSKAIINLNNDKTTMQLQMNPEHLGKVAVTITAEQGVVKGEFVAENNVVKEMLETNMIQLKAQLEEQGVKVDKIEVALGSTGQYFNQRDQKNQDQQPSNQSSKYKARRIEALMQVDELEAIETELQRRSEVSAEAYTVEYSA